MGHLPVSIYDALRTCFAVEGKKREMSWWLIPYGDGGDGGGGEGTGSDGRGERTGSGGGGEGTVRCNT